MLELQCLALLNSLMNWGTAPVFATRAVAADAPTVHVLLSDPAHERALAAGIPATLRPRVRMSPKAGPRFRHASVQLAGRDTLWLTWLVVPGRGSTEVELAAQLESDGILARLVLRASRRRLRRHLELALGALAEAARRTAEDCDAAAEDRVSVGPAPVGMA
jgi:hypothetical protein